MNVHFFSGRFLNAEALQAEQSYHTPQHALDKVSLNPQPLPPRVAFEVLPAHKPQPDGQTLTLQLQALLSALQQSSSLASNAIQAHDQATSTVIGRIG